MADEKKSPLDSAVELLVYAPLGLALVARDQLPDLIAKGRSRVTGQVTMARMIGEFAVREGEKDLRKRLSGMTETLSALGILPEQPTPGVPPSPPAPAPSPAASPPVTPPAAPAPEAASSSELSIPGYDTLSASQVVQRLGGLTPDELEAVRKYESGARGRRTILSKIAQLQSGPA